MWPPDATGRKARLRAMNSRLLTAVSVVVVVALAEVLGYAIIRGVTADPAVVGSFLTAAM